jgi:hypothetical protein
MNEHRGLEIPISAKRKAKMAKDEKYRETALGLAKKYDLKKAKPRQTKKGKWVGMSENLTPRRR